MHLKRITKEQYISLAQMKMPVYACDSDDEVFGNQGIDHLKGSRVDLANYLDYSEEYSYFYALVDDEDA